MNIINAFVGNYMKEAESDYVGLWQLAWSLRQREGIQSDAEVKEKTLQIAQKLIEKNVMPGNLAAKGGFDFWPGAPSELLARIEAEWPKTGIPRLDYNACWFAQEKV